MPFLAVTLGGVWHKELHRLVTGSGADISKTAWEARPFGVVALGHGPQLLFEQHGHGLGKYEQVGLALA